MPKSLSILMTYSFGFLRTTRVLHANHTSPPILPSEGRIHVPKNVLTLAPEYSPYIPIDMCVGLHAWTYHASQLSKAFYSQPFNELEAKLYQGVDDFARRGAQLNPTYRITSPLYRTILDTYCHPEILRLLETPPSHLKTNQIVPYKNRIPFGAEPIITFAPVTSWTTYNLLDPTEAEWLGSFYPDTLYTNVIFVIQDPEGKTGSVIGNLSLVQGEEEALLPSNTNLQIDKMAHWNRPKLNIHRHAHKDTSESRVIHVVYLRHCS